MKKSLVILGGLLLTLTALVLINVELLKATEEIPSLSAVEEPQIIEEVIIPKTQEEQQEVAEIASEIEYLGEFTITHYCACKVCCGKWADGITASGKTAVEGVTIAVDTKVIPLGSEVIIDGWTYIAQDTGSAIKGNRIDIFIDDHDRALKMGKYQANVYKGE